MAEYILVHGIRVAKSWEPETFGRLTTIGPVFLLPDKNGKRYAFQVCRCSCGNVGVFRTKNFKTNKSCGCLQRETAVTTHTIHGHSTRSCVSPEYNSWKSMRRRCYREECVEYPYYGGRGIRVCDRWLGESGFQNFLEDMGPRSEGLTLDRIDPNGHYCPENCRWATKTQQARNTRRSRDKFATKLGVL